MLRPDLLELVRQIAAEPQQLVPRQLAFDVVQLAVIEDVTDLDPAAVGGAQALREAVPVKEEVVRDLGCFIDSLEGLLLSPLRSREDPGLPFRSLLVQLLEPLLPPAVGQLPPQALDQDFPSSSSSAARKFATFWDSSTTFSRRRG